MSAVSPDLVNTKSQSCVGREWSLGDEDFELLADEIGMAPTRAEIRKWPKELKDKRKLQLHCRRMLRFRVKRAAQKKTMKEEYFQLEQELEQQLVQLRQRGLNLSLSRVQREMQRLVLEREVLREESVSLGQEIAKFERFLRIIQSASLQIAPTPENDPKPTGSTCTNTTVRCIEAKWQSVQEEAGHRVYFDGRPSFFFHPFSSREFDDVLRRHDVNSSIDSSQLTFNGKYLGWGIYSGRNLQGKRYLIDQVRCSKTIRKPMDSILNGMKRDDGSSKWPIIPKSRDIGVKAEISTQTVQHFDENKYLIVLDYSGAVKIRYLCLVQQSNTQQLDGKRVAKFYFVLGDSEANARGRDAESPAENDVDWIIEEAGYSLTLREVDDDAVEATFDSLACVGTDDEARCHFIKFGNVVTRWEQLVMSSNLLNF